MPDARQNGTLGNAVSVQAVGDQAPRIIPRPLQQTLEETLRCRAVPPSLHQNVQHHSVLVHRAPHIMQHASDPDEHLVEVPSVTGRGRGSAQPTGGSELAAPVSDALAG